MINPRISARPNRLHHFLVHHVYKNVHTKAEVVHLTPGLLGLGVLFNSRIGNVLRNI